MFKSFVNIQELEAVTSTQLVPTYSNTYIPSETYWATPHQPQSTCQCGANKVDVSAHPHAIWNQTEMEPAQYTQRQWTSESTPMATTGYPSPISSPASEQFLVTRDEADRSGFYSKPSLDHYAEQMFKMEKLGNFSDYAPEGAYSNMMTTEVIFEGMSKYRNPSISSGLCTPLASPVMADQQTSQDVSSNCEFLMYAGSSPMYTPPQQKDSDQESTTSKSASKPQPSHYKCDFPDCTATFTRPYNLKSHKRTHTNERPYACPHEGCNKTFARHHDRNRHAKLHMGLKPYSCPHCKKCFARQDALIRHSKIENAPCSQVVQTKKMPLKFKFLNGR
ncbi:hypothetical protein BGW37DRAFT_494836 [Umbelopsis sp. PMI_123]|nr:hypothetical protein BGW37DRAFT_494836 [Umbelopsis sp. PMI_123]